MFNGAEGAGGEVRVIEELRRGELRQDCRCPARFFVAQFGESLAGHAGGIAIVSAILQDDDGGGVAGLDLQGEDTAAADGFVVLVGRDDQHGSAERRADGDGFDEAGKVIGEGGKRQHPEVDATESGVFEEFVPATAVEQGVEQPVDAADRVS